MRSPEPQFPVLCLLITTAALVDTCSLPRSMTDGKTNQHVVPANRWRFPVSTELLCLLIVVVASALAMSPNVADPDLWGHVQFGRDVLTDGEIAKTTSYSFTAEGYRWINHENISEIVMALVADTRIVRPSRRSQNAEVLMACFTVKSGP